MSLYLLYQMVRPALQLHSILFQLIPSLPILSENAFAVPLLLRIVFSVYNRTRVIYFTANYILQWLQNHYIKMRLKLFLFVPFLLFEHFGKLAETGLPMAIGYTERTIVEKQPTSQPTEQPKKDLILLCLPCFVPFYHFCFHLFFTLSLSVYRSSVHTLCAIIFMHLCSPHIRSLGFTLYGKAALLHSIHE